jgi:hypothetical protein
LSAIPKWQALCYLLVMIFVTSSSAWIFTVQHQLSLKTYKGWRSVWRAYFKYAIRYLGFYTAMILLIMLWLGAAKVASDALHPIFLLVGVLGAIYAVMRCAVILPVLSQGYSLRKTIVHSWRLGVRQNRYLLVHTVVLLLLLFLGLACLALLQTFVFFALHFGTWSESDRLFWLQGMAGLSVFFTLPFIHAYLLSIWQQLECRLADQGEGA